MHHLPNSPNLLGRLHKGHSRRTSPLLRIIAQRPVDSLSQPAELGLPHTVALKPLQHEHKHEFEHEHPHEHKWLGVGKGCGCLGARMDLETVAWALKHAKSV